MTVGPRNVEFPSDSLKNELKLGFSLFMFCIVSYHPPEGPLILADASFALWLGYYLEMTTLVSISSVPPCFFTRPGIS